MEETNREYVGASSRALRLSEVSGRVAGFVSIESHNPRSAEVHVMAVDRGLDRQVIKTIAVGERAAREGGPPHRGEKT